MASERTGKFSDTEIHQRPATHQRFPRRANSLYFGSGVVVAFFLTASLFHFFSAPAIFGFRIGEGHSTFSAGTKPGEQDCEPRWTAFGAPNRPAEMGTDAGRK